MKAITTLFLSAAIATAATASNVFHVGDVINLKVVGYEEELNGSYRVGVDGTVEIPFVGRIQAEGLTADALQEATERRIWSYYINRPQVIIEPLFTITVLGHVNRPGPYQVQGGEKLSSLIAMAGGERSDARLSKTTVTRNGTSFDQNLKSALQKSKTVNDVGIQSGDIIYVPKSSIWSNWQTWAAIVSSVSLSVAVYDRISR